MGAEILLLGALAMLASNLQSGKVRLFGGMTENIKTIPKQDTSRPLIPPPPPDADNSIGTGQSLLDGVSGNRAGVRPA